MSKQERRATYGPRAIQPTIFFRKLLPNYFHPINLCPDIVAPSAGGRLLAGCSSTCISERGFGVVKCNDGSAEAREENMGQEE